MKTHMNNTTAINMKNDIMANKVFQKHQQALHSGSIKPNVITKHKQQVKVVKNNKVQINSNPNQHVKILFSNLHNKKNSVKSTIDNKVPDTYQLKGTVLKDKMSKNKQAKHQLTEHQREWKALQNRIDNCKSLQQRKKDKTDPITNPVYFIKDGSKAGDITIQPYCKKVLSNNRPKSAIMPGTRATQTFHMANNSIARNLMDQPTSMHYGSAVPDYSKTGTQGFKKQNKIRPSTAKQMKQNKNDDLPEPSYKGILSHLLEKKIYRDSDVKVLYVRLCYAYGQDNIDMVWEQVMDYLEK